MRLLLSFFIFLLVSCNTRIGSTTYGRNFKTKQKGNLDSINNDSLNLFIGFLHKKINRNPKKNYTVFGCCYDSFYSAALKNIKPHLNERGVAVVSLKNLRRDETVEDLLKQIQRRKINSVPAQFVSSEKGTLILYFNYWERHYISGSGPAPGGLREGTAVSDIIINADIIYLKDSQTIIYKNVYMVSLKEYFNPNSDAIWKRLIDNLFK